MEFLGGFDFCSRSIISIIDIARTRSGGLGVAAYAFSFDW